MTQTQGNPVEILLVEDSPGDVLLTKEALKETKISNNLYIASDGVQALDFLYKKGAFSDAPEPDLILLDLNMPRKDGREVLDDVKNNSKLRHIPVVILTTSDSEKDILKSYNLHANCYIQKPVAMNGFIEVVKSIDSFWFSIVKLPPKDVGEDEKIAAEKVA